LLFIVVFEDVSNEKGVAIGWVYLYTSVFTLLSHFSH